MYFYVFFPFTVLFAMPRAVLLQHERVPQMERYDGLEQQTVVGDQGTELDAGPIVDG